MMVTVNVLEAKTTLSQLLAKVEVGEEVVIARSGKPVARLVPAEADIHRAAGILAACPEWQSYDRAMWAPQTDEQLAEDGWPL